VLRKREAVNVPDRQFRYLATKELSDHALRLIGLVALAITLESRGVLIFAGLRNPEPVTVAFDEDAYYGFAVARNVAGGNGITAAHGEPTNGFQPLWTFLLVPAFALAGSDRAALASIYLPSIVLWLTAAWLFAGLIARHAESAESGLGKLIALPCLALFLGDVRLTGYFFNGLETGCYAVALLLFWRWLEVEKPLREQASPQLSLAFGLRLGALLLVRNDAVLIAPFLLLAGARRGLTLRRIALAAGIAGVVFLPWIIYNYLLTGGIQPQSGVATMMRAGQNLLDPVRVRSAVRAVLEQITPPILPGITTLPSWCLATSAIILCLGFAWAWRREAEAKLLARSAAPLVGGAVALVAYYTLFSRVTSMYARYFMPIRLLSMAAWSLLLFAVLRACRSQRRSIAAVILLAAATASAAHTATEYATPSSPPMGEELRRLIAAGLCDGPARVAMFDSGRSGYRCTPWVVNLDGKSSLGSLRARTDHRLLEYLATAGIDRLFLRDYHVLWFDRFYPEWRRQFTSAGSAGRAAIFARDGASVMPSSSTLGTRREKETAGPSADRATSTDPPPAYSLSQIP